MAEYRCFSCDKIIADNHIRKKVRCIYCGSKVIFKPRTKPATVLAR